MNEGHDVGVDSTVLLLYWYAISVDHHHRHDALTRVYGGTP